MRKFHFAGTHTYSDGGCRERSTSRPALGSVYTGPLPSRGIDFEHYYRRRRHTGRISDPQLKSEAKFCESRDTVARRRIIGERGTCAR
ncbi:unnamed protein product, partial [Iphiclides podalirius]